MAKIHNFWASTRIQLMEWGYFCTFLVMTLYHKRIIVVFFSPINAKCTVPFCNRPKLKLIIYSSCISVTDTEKSSEVNLIVGALTFIKTPIICLRLLV